jgi:hypothetical protein
LTRMTRGADRSRGPTPRPSRPRHPARPLRRGFATPNHAGFRERVVRSLPRRPVAEALAEAEAPPGAKAGHFSVRAVGIRRIGRPRTPRFLDRPVSPGAIAADRAPGKANCVAPMARDEIAAADAAVLLQTLEDRIRSDRIHPGPASSIS